MLLSANLSASIFFSVRLPFRFKPLFLLVIVISISAPLRAETPILQTCEAHLQSLAYQEAFDCLQSHRPAQLKPEEDYSQQWLTLWLSYHLQMRDTQQRPKQDLAPAISLAQTWMKAKESSVAHKQQLSYLVYLYYSGLNANASLPSPPPIQNKQIDGNQTSLLGNAFLIFLLFSLCIGSFIFVYDTYRKKPGNSATSKALHSPKKERHQNLIQQYSQLQDYSIANSHLVRAPLARMLGLVELLQDEPLTADGQFYLQNLTQSCAELDQWISNMNDILEQKEAERDHQQVVEELSHFLSKEK
ncbi:MAG: hypothetical protein AAFP02_11775 [Bacteroidota bacterium]